MAGSGPWVGKRKSLLRRNGNHSNNSPGESMDREAFQPIVYGGSQSQEHDQRSDLAHTTPESTHISLRNYLPYLTDLLRADTITI